MDLFSFPDELGSGLPVFHPKGGIIRKAMEDYSRKRHEEAGYEFVYTPHITKGHLYEVSGHLDWYRDGMFPPCTWTRAATPDRRGHQARPGLLPEADELPDAQPDLPRRADAPTASCRCGCSSSARSTATRSPAWCTA